MQLALFDYDTLDNETRDFIQQRTGEIKTLMRRTAQDIIEIGQRLIAVKARLGHGHFGGWLELEFDWNQKTAERFIHVASKFDNLSNLNFAPSALYLLAAPSTPDEAREEALERAEMGDPITHSVAREIVQSHRQPTEAADQGDLDSLPFLPEATPARLYGYPPMPQPYAPPPTIPFDRDAALAQHLQFHCPDCQERFSAPVGHCQNCDHHYSAEDQMCLNCCGVRHAEPARDASSHARAVLVESKNNEWYTPPEFLIAARELMGAIDLDPASNPIANTAVQARRYHTIDDDGLAHEWHGRIWMNPPYGKEGGESNQSRWTQYLIEQYQAGNITEAVCLVNAVPGNQWFAPLWQYPICFPSRRIRFYGPDGEPGDPTFSNALVYLGPQIAKFVRIFSQFGPVAAQLREHAGEVFIPVAELQREAA